ncbi:hypothetical protein BaRGS_00023228 [Batillaria attramentaria]|uniref:Secreted protein n=1 Tax=Batillaria attramentaria TaxID=370345 RepID=A0ABD0KEZ2_9CAEN
MCRMMDPPTRSVVVVRSTVCCVITSAGLRRAPSVVLAFDLAAVAGGCKLCSSYTVRMADHCSVTARGGNPSVADRGGVLTGFTVGLAIAGGEPRTGNQHWDRLTTGRHWLLLHHSLLGAVGDKGFLS